VGDITVPASVGDVFLAATFDDGVRVWLDNVLCIDNWGPNDSVTTQSKLKVTAGLRHRLRVEYLQLAGRAIINLRWQVANYSQSVSCWIPPGNWINAWTGALVKGPATIQENVPLECIPMFIRSGAIFALAPQMQYTRQLPWSPITLDAYPSTTETNSTLLYEDDTLTTAYKHGQFRNTTIKTWADDFDKSVSVNISAAEGSFTNALMQRAWTVRLRRPQNWPSNYVPVSVKLNGRAIGPIIHHAINSSATPLGADDGAPDGDVFEVKVPQASVLKKNCLVADFKKQPLKLLGK